jgi:hypothetical protein
VDVPVVVPVVLDPVVPVVAVLPLPLLQPISVRPTETADAAEQRAPGQGARCDLPLQPHGESGAGYDPCAHCRVLANHGYYSAAGG